MRCGAVNITKDSEQARLVKTINFHKQIAKSVVDKTVGGVPSILLGWLCRYGLGHQPVGKRKR